MPKEAYNPAQIEPKWQKYWDDTGAFRAENHSDKPKFYGLIEFPYPSGYGLHVGHPRSNTALDIIARKRRMQGYNVLFPMGWDAFGLPTENFAIKNKIHPRLVSEKNIAHFKEQLHKLGFSFDWSREVDTTDPAYYKWTQWIFLKLYEQGLAYKAEVPINFCTSCKVALANEEVVGGVCERCGGEVVRKVKSQWMLRITAYAQKLLDGLEDLDFIEKVKLSQRNWIGRSEGAEVLFQLEGRDEALKVFTTRPDTLFGATYMVVSPEHPLVDEVLGQLPNAADVVAYREAAQHKSDFERTELNKEKTGVPLTGVYAINPVNGQRLPIWISDYVLMGYGTGAIMAVPAHDGRDYDFAKAFGLPIVEVVGGGDISEQAFEDIQTGTMVNSGFLNGLTVAQAKQAIIEWLRQEGKGTPKVNFKLRDWVFSRQRYWGEPIPMVHCEKCGWVPLPESELPLLLPDTDNYMPTDTGESPLALFTDWVNTTCPHCGGPAQRETDTMPQWAGSSWYFLRYTDPHNDQAFASPEALSYWLPVDWYNGGMEHTTLHLLYSRFWHRFLYDQGLVPCPEPYLKRTSHGMILGEDGVKMSKSRGNVINPDDIVAEIGADAFRVYEMFMGAFDQPIPWSTNGARGCRRFLDRIWRMQDMLTDSLEETPALRATLHETIRNVDEDYERMKYNTAIAAMMSFVNACYDHGSLSKGDFRQLLLLLSPVAPHIAEELWQQVGLPGLASQGPWPTFDPHALVRETAELAVQINGKVRGRITVPADAPEAEIIAAAQADATIAPQLAGKQVRKAIVIKGRLVNLVVG